MENIFQKNQSVFLKEKKNTIQKSIKKKNKSARKHSLESIVQEYESKQKSFNPDKPSPNKFIKNLEIRMRMYYKDLYK
jgi:hypothetical protein